MPLGGVRLGVLDVADTEEGRARPEEVAALEAEFAALAAAEPTWLVLHRPVWSVVRVEGPRVVGGNDTLASAARRALPGNVALLLSGHLHVFQVLDFRGDLPPQMIVGHGGTLLDQGTPPRPAGLVIEDVTERVAVADGVSRPGQFGFVVLERGADGWSAVNHALDGRPIDRCRLLRRRLACG